MYLNLNSAEREALRRMIDYATMPEEFRAQARGWLDAPIGLDVGDLRELSEERRVFIYSVASALTKVDSSVAHVVSAASGSASMEG